MQYKNTAQTSGMKHGIATEPHAKKAYIEQAKKNHVNFKAEETGLCLIKDYPYIAATPDLSATCECHGKINVEIKCPLTLVGVQPSCSNYSAHIEEKDGVHQLKRNSPYYFQVHGQMAATDTMKTDFFIYSTGGYLITPVSFDAAFWEVVRENLCWFWLNQVAPELLTKRIQHDLDIPPLQVSTRPTVERHDALLPIHFNIDEDMFSDEMEIDVE